MKTNVDLSRMTDEEWGHAVAQSEFDYDDPAQEEFPIDGHTVSLRSLKKSLKIIYTQ